MLRSIQSPDKMTDETSTHHPESLKTDLQSDEIRKRLDESNRRGKLPEIEWIDSERFRFKMPSRPMITWLNGRIESTTSEDGSTRCVSFTVELNRRMLHLYLIVMFLSVVVGTPVTHFLWPWLYVWWWNPPIGLASMIWIWWKWPGRSLADGQSLTPKWIDLIRQRLS